MSSPAIGWPTVLPLVQAPATGTSGDAKQVADLLRAFADHERQKASDWRPVVRAKIEQLAIECSTSNWDGYSGAGISQLTKRKAQYFVDLLPVDLPEPEVAPDPEGDIALCWDFGRDLVFTVNIDETETLSFAGLLGRGVKRHGQEPFRGDVPKILIESIREISPLESSR
jgi:hypothetical protein